MKRTIYESQGYRQWYGYQFKDDETILSDMNNVDYEWLKLLILLNVLERVHKQEYVTTENGGAMKVLDKWYMRRNDGTLIPIKEGDYIMNHSQRPNETLILSQELLDVMFLPKSEDYETATFKLNND